MVHGRREERPTLLVFKEVLDLPSQWGLTLRDVLEIEDLDK